MPAIMQVHKYIPDRMFGFVIDPSGHEVFFHLGAFDPGRVWLAHSRCDRCPSAGCPWTSSPPPPILGEDVEVTVNLVDGFTGKAPRASRVARLVGPPAVFGRVETFDPQRGYGFIRGEDDQSYHLHASEILDGRIPLPNQGVMFFAGFRQSRPRACHVKVCP